MEISDNDDVFDDFDRKVSGKKEHPKKFSKVHDDDKLNWKFRDERQALKDKFKKELRDLEVSKAKEEVKRGRIPTKNLGNIERITYIVIVIILLGYLVFDLSFLHGDKTSEIDINQEITATVVNDENKTVEPEVAPKEETVKEPVKEEVKEEPKLSGIITFSIEKIYSEVDENNDDIGEISRITFVIENGVDDILNPIVNVYVYDDKSEEYYETRSRGEYTFPVGIAPGKTHTGSIDLSPKKYSNLNLKKKIRLVLNDTEDGFIKAITDEITIS